MRLLGEQQEALATDFRAAMLRLQLLDARRFPPYHEGHDS
jgi:hypothetical protein